MARLRISGLVREATSVEEALRTGVPEGDRERFLARVRETVAEVERLLDLHATADDDLPPRSRHALEFLRHVAVHEPADLPLPRPGAPPPAPKARLRNVVSSLEHCLLPLEDGRADEATLRRVHGDAVAMADGILAVCRQQGATPATLPSRSREAYALLRWLADRVHLDAYAAQVRLALPILATVEEWGGGLGEEAWGRAPRARFTLGRRIYRVRRRGDAVLWDLSLGLLSADAEDLRALVARVALRDQAPPDLLRRYHELVEGEDFGAVLAEAEMLADPMPHLAKGRIRDLDALFDRLDARFFRGSLPRPHLHWAPTYSRRRFGFHVASRDLVCLNPILDDPQVPEFVTEFVLYHELLHKKHGVRLAGGRRHVHTAAFAQDEALHPDRAAAQAWLLRLAGRVPETPAAAEVDPAEDAGTPPEDPDADLPDPRALEDRAPDLTAEARLPGAVAPPTHRSAPAGRAPGRNDPCWCGSGHKYKRCHLAADDGTASA